MYGMQLGKKAFQIHFSFLEQFKLTTKEIILLQQIEFVNNKSDFLYISIKTLAKITHMSRNHLYRCLKKLCSLNFVLKSDDGLCVTEYYRELKAQDLTRNFSKATNEKVQICEKAQSTTSSQAQNIAVQNTTNKKAQNTTSKATNEKVQICEKAQSTTSSQAQNIAVQNTTNKKAQSTTSKATNEKVQICEKAQSTTSKATNEKVQICEKAQSTTSSQAQNIAVQNTTKSKANTSKKQNFFSPKVQQNVTKVSHNVTHSIHYNNKEYNSLYSQIREYKDDIYFSSKEESVKRELREKLSSLLTALSSPCTLKDFNLHKEIFKEVVQAFRFDVTKKTFKVTNIPCVNELKTLLKGQYLFCFDNLMLEELKKDIESLNEENRLQEAITYSLKHEKFWLCTEDNSDDSKGREGLKSYLLACLKLIQPQDKNTQIQELKELYKDKIEAFLLYRKQKGRELNFYAKNALYELLYEFQNKKRDIAACIEQSICRGYNWIFPLTHKKRRLKQ